MPYRPQPHPFFQSYYIYNAADQLIVEGIEDDEIWVDAGPPSPSLVLTRQYIYLAGRPLAHVDLGTGIPLLGCSGSSIAGLLTLKGVTLGLIWLGLMVLLGWRLMRHKDTGRIGRTVGMGLLLALAVGLPLAVMSCGSQQMPAAIFHYNTDILGTPVMVTDSNKNIAWQARYDEFGGVEKVKRTTRESYTPLRFPGQYDDRDKALVGEEGPYYNLHRYYDPMTGRYTTPDPIGLEIGTNVYSYTANEPVNRSDPRGLYDIYPGVEIMNAYQKAGFSLGEAQAMVNKAGVAGGIGAAGGLTFWGGVAATVAAMRMVIEAYRVVLAALAALKCADKIDPNKLHHIFDNLAII